MTLSIITKLQEIGESIKQFIVANATPWLFLLIFIIGIIVFMITYKALHKKDTTL